MKWLQYLFPKFVDESHNILILVNLSICLNEWMITLHTAGVTLENKISSNRMTETVSLGKFISTYSFQHDCTCMNESVDYRPLWKSACRMTKIRRWEEQIPLVGWIVGELQDSEVNHKERQRTMWIRSKCEGWCWTKKYSQSQCHWSQVGSHGDLFQFLGPLCK